MKTTMLFLLLVFALISCKDESTNPKNEQMSSFSFESSKCLSHRLGKGTAPILDSMFTYSFDQYLVMDFSAQGNCCPDSGRFVLGHTIHMDTIFINVVDTAQNLCNCICPYMIHAEVKNLTLDKYIVCCRLGDGHNYYDTLHLVVVEQAK
jgi:hypothetical protein